MKIRELNSTQFEESDLSDFNVSLHSLTQKKFGSMVRLYAFLERSVSDGSNSENGGASGSASGARTDSMEHKISKQKLTMFGVM